jgi:hypothetical protein
MVVSNRAVVAAIPMRHLSRVKRVNVNWRLIEEGAQPRRRTRERSESFVEGNSFGSRADPGESRFRARPPIHRRNDCCIARRRTRADAAGRDHDLGES